MEVKAILGKVGITSKYSPFKISIKTNELTTIYLVFSFIANFSNQKDSNLIWSNPRNYCILNLNERTQSEKERNVTRTFFFYFRIIRPTMPLM